MAIEMDDPARDLELAAQLKEQVKELNQKIEVCHKAGLRIDLTIEHADGHWSLVLDTYRKL